MCPGGGPPATGASNESAAPSGEPVAFADLWPLLSDADPLVRARAIEAAVRATRARPQLLAPFAADLLSGPLDGDRGELGWQLLPMAAQLELTPEQTARLMRRCEDAVLNHGSQLVQAEALGAAFVIAQRDRRHVARVRSLARTALKSSSAALAMRARELLDGD